MAKVQKVIGDQNSQEFDELRRSFNTLLAVLENLGANLVSATPVESGGALQDALVSGVDDNPNTISNVVVTGLPIHGIDSTPKHPRRAIVGKIVDLDLKKL